MASEIRVDKINSLSGVGTVTLSPTGVDIAGITTAATLRATTGIVTSLTAGSLTSLGAVSGTTGTFSGAVSGTTGTFSGAVSGTTGTFSAAVSGTTGTFTGDVDIADKIVHTGDTDTAIRFSGADTITAETGGSERFRIDSSGNITNGGTFTTNNFFSGGIHLKKQSDVGIKFQRTQSGDSQTWDWGVSSAGHLTAAHVGDSGGSSTTKTVFNKNGNLEISDGDLVMGTSGHGISFAVTSDSSGMTSELLDDYEEGTFTPNWDAGGGVTFSYNHQYGFYTKIGDTVTFQLYLMGHASSISSGNGGNGVVIQGLPYTIQNHSRYYPAFTIGRTYNVDINDNKRLYSYGDSNSTNIRLILEEGDTVGSLLTAQQLDRNPCLMQVGGVYRI